MIQIGLTLPFTLLKSRYIGGATSEISVLTRESLASECMHAGAAARVLNAVEKPQRDCFPLLA
jgi:hypothetical protein